MSLLSGVHRDTFRKGEMGPFFPDSLAVTLHVSVFTLAFGGNLGVLGWLSLLLRSSFGLLDDFLNKSKLKAT